MNNDEEYKLYNYDDILKALKQTKKNKGGWTGPDELHYSVGVTFPNPSYLLSEDNLEYEKERGRNLDQVLYNVAFALGFHNGLVKAEQRLRDVEEQRDRLVEALKIRNELEPVTPHEDSVKLIGSIWLDSIKKSDL